MSQQIPPEIGPQEIDVILKFLDIFSQEGYKFGESVIKSGEFPYLSYHANVRAFIGALYEQNMLFSLIAQVGKMKHDDISLIRLRWRRRIC